MHGPHQEAQKFTTTGLPWSWHSSSLNACASSVGRALGLVGRSFVPEPQEAAEPREAHAAARMVRAAATAADRARSAPRGPFMRSLIVHEKRPIGWPHMGDALDLPTLRRAMRIYAEALRTHREELDSLNVYPVPDGDTGTNMLLTQTAVVDALEATAEGGLPPDVKATISRASLMGARGNSGVILSQILRGIVEAMPM